MVLFILILRISASGFFRKMGNKTTTEQWSGRERLRFLEAAAYWRGVVGRGDLMAAFRVSGAQATGDLQAYQELNPQALTYNLSGKRYEAAAEMPLLWRRMPFEQALRHFLLAKPEWAGQSWAEDEAVEPENTAELVMPQANSTREAGPRPTSLRKPNATPPPVGSGDRVASVVLPAASPPPQVERWLFQSVLWGLRLRIQYFSVHGASANWRWIRPHAFGHNGNRWHVRAWCEERLAHRDFVISRMAAAEPPLAETTEDAEAGSIPPDRAWMETVTLKLQPASHLTADQQLAVRQQYGMRDGFLEVTCRRAMEGYLRARLGMPMPGEALPPLGMLEEEQAPKKP